MTHTEIELPPAVHRVANQISRGFRMLASPEATAAYICGSGEVAEGLAALPELKLQRAVLEQLRARHVVTTIPDRWHSGITDVEVCNSCRTAWPCGDAEILGVAR